MVNYRALYSQGQYIRNNDWLKYECYQGYSVLKTKDEDNLVNCKDGQSDKFIPNANSVLKKAVQ